MLDGFLNLPCWGSDASHGTRHIRHFEVYSSLTRGLGLPWAASREPGISTRLVQLAALAAFAIASVWAVLFSGRERSRASTAFRSLSASTRSRRRRL